ncbi:C40 family peptidase [Aquimarina sp. RZ0]|uniref:C40 family peptidase n=1 Tax=Aquimarina sp. RZ0 TaxID=2607730 RepID=UPI0011F100E1|nr:C40 family peptidase [Aquimarina sp. RZ0]KAA1245327.1 NlpC/P60 family protein [Aquimarina sp. RZ0]
MNILSKALILFIVVVGVLSCGGSKNAEQEALAQARRDSIALAQQNTVSPIQKKYGAILGVPAKKIDNIPLFEFIDDWMNTPYKLGGETKDGIDCSFFTQYVFHDVYGNLIERTAQKQFDAPDTNKFKGQHNLKQGDLIFFNSKGSEFYDITHVGFYLGNDKFVHSTSRKGTSGKNGVQISNLKKQPWKRMFVAGGKKPKISNATTQN